MPITVGDLIRTPELLAALGPSGTSLPVCQICEFAIEPEEPVETMGDGRHVHADCYYDTLGAAVEEHPIPSPRL